MRVVRAIMICILVCIVAVILYAGWNRSGPNRTEAAFNPGGKIALQLSAGGYDIQGSTENKIRLELPPGETRNVICRMSVSGNKARIQIEGPSNNFHATIHVPQKSDLDVDQTIGDLVVANVEGNKTLGLNIGKMEIEVPSGPSQPSFKGSILIGDLHAGPWRVEKGGFFREFDLHSSSSPYYIRAHVDIGDLEVRDSGRGSDTQKSGEADNDVPEKDSEDEPE